MAMNVPDRVKKNTISIMKHKKFCAFSGVIACGKVIYSKEIATACTNGWDTQYNEAFIREHCDTEPKLRFLILHEAVHKAYRHLHVWRALWSEDAQTANIAMDHFVNLSLLNTDAGEGFIVMPDVGVQPDQKYKGWSVVMIYKDIKKECKGKGKDGEGKPGGQPGEGKGNGEGEGEPTGMDEHDWKGAAEAKEVTKERDDEIGRAIRQGEAMRKKLAGKGSADGDGQFGELLNPVIDWKKVLREFVTELCSGKDESSWKKPNRRLLADDIIMPALMGTSMGELVIGFDTSGSVFCGKEMDRFATEIEQIAKMVMPKKIHVIYWDTRVKGHQTFDEGQFVVNKLVPKGGGGTDGAVLFDYLRDKRMTPDAIVQFTDGYVGDWGNSKTPTLWAVTTEMKSPWGTTVRVQV